MASLLRQIVAGPRSRHPEAGLDLCYVTDNIIATSGPSSTYPKRAYRNPTDALVKFLDSKHDANWGIWEFRAEGTGYPDSEVYNRIHHFPWPDHHPPPFAIIPQLMASIRNWLKDEKKGKKRVAVVHCKAGKGRSGTVVCSYLISEEGWKREDALARFTERRMRAGFGEGVSIPSQLRWVHYVDRWTREMGKMYVERKVEIVEIHVWGLKDGVKVAVEGYTDEGKKIKAFHVFTKEERMIVDDGNGANDKDVNSSVDSPTSSQLSHLSAGPISPPATVTNPNDADPGGPAVIFRPTEPVIVPTPDINIDFERRNKAAYTGWTMVTSVAHVWFNPYFEGGDKENSGVFEIEWAALDGVKGSARKGIRALDKVAVVWRYPTEALAQSTASRVITEPKEGEPVMETKPADWRGADQGASPNASGTHLGKNLGLRTESPASANISRASSVHTLDAKEKVEDIVKKGDFRNDEDSGSELEGVRTLGPDGEEVLRREEEASDKETSRDEGEDLFLDYSTKADKEDVADSEPSEEDRRVADIGLGKLEGIVRSMGNTSLDKTSLNDAEDHRT